MGREYLPQDFHIEFNRVKRRAGFAIPSLIKIGEWTAASGFYNVKAQSFDFGGFSLQAVAIHVSHPYTCNIYIYITHSK